MPGLKAPERPRTREAPPHKKPEAPRGTPITPGDKTAIDEGLAQPERRRTILEVLTGKKVAEKAREAKIVGATKAMGEKKRISEKKKAKISEKVNEENARAKQELNDEMQRRKNSEDPTERASGYDLEIHLTKQDRRDLQESVVSLETMIRTGEIPSESMDEAKTQLESGKEQLVELNDRLTKIQTERSTIVDADSKVVPDQIREEAANLIKTKGINLDNEAIQQLQNDPLDFIYGHLRSLTQNELNEVMAQSAKTTSKDLELSKPKKAGILALLFTAYLLYTSAKKATRDTGGSQGGMM